MSDAGAVTRPEGGAGATPLEPDEGGDLLPTHVTTQRDVNAWEQANIARADRWAMSRRRRAASVLTPEFAERLHRRMFDETWRWAGRYRRTDKNIGVAWTQVRVTLRERLQDAALWLAEGVYPVDEIAARLHHQLVLIHPWPNGNGRWSRLMADVLLHAEGRARFSWGGGDLVNATDTRADYLAALREADRGDLSPLLRFVRR